MKRKLTAQERNGLQAVSDFGERMHPVQKGDMPGIGQKTLDTLAALGLIHYVRTKWNTDGYLVTEKGEQVMYGKTMREILATSGPHTPLRVWEVESEG